MFGEIIRIMSAVKCNLFVVNLQYPTKTVVNDFARLQFSRVNNPAILIISVVATLNPARQPNIVAV